MNAESGPPRSVEVAHLLRELALAVHGGEVGDDARAAAFAHLRAAHELLRDGEPRRRWYEVDPDDGSATRARNRELSAFSGMLNPIAPPMAIEAGTLEDGRPALVGRVRLDRLREGPPRSGHGGVIAGLFDELLGGGQRLATGAPGMTARLNVRFRRPTPIEQDLELWAWVHDERLRRVVVRAECVVAATGPGPHRPGGERVTAEAEALFLGVDFEGLEAGLRDRPDGTPPPPAPRGRS